MDLLQSVHPSRREAKKSRKKVCFSMQINSLFAGESVWTTAPTTGPALGRINSDSFFLCKSLSQDSFHHFHLIINFAHCSNVWGVDGQKIKCAWNEKLLVVGKEFFVRRNWTIQICYFTFSEMKNRISTIVRRGEWGWDMELECDLLMLTVNINALRYIN